MPAFAPVFGVLNLLIALMAGMQFGRGGGLRLFWGAASDTLIDTVPMVLFRKSSR